MKWLESFSERHAHTIALLESISTTAAVIVALSASYAAKRATRPRLSAKISVMQIIYGDGSPIGAAPSYIAAVITNTGTVPVKLTSSFFTWRLPMRNQMWLAMPIDETGDGHVKRVYPCIIPPNTSETFFVTSMATFKSTMPDILNAGKFGPKITAKLLRGFVYANDGSQFRALLTSSFHKELTALSVKTAPPTDGGSQ